ncbi:MAG: S24 family peptidase, partial [Candidatus Omnitrophica bacterium]|nr:S24 family peptidase [Candidatus Omnitrophota bacterium]
ITSLLNVQKNEVRDFWRAAFKERVGESDERFLRGSRHHLESIPDKTGMISDKTKKYSSEERLIPVFDASCGALLDWSDGSYPAGHYPRTEPADSKDKNAFYVLARGDLMTGHADDRRTIFDGDLLLIEPGKPVENGDIVLCRFDNGVIIKKFKHEDGRIRLIPLNDKYPITDLTEKDKSRVFAITEIKRKLR